MQVFVVQQHMTDCCIHVMCTILFVTKLKSIEQQKPFLHISEAQLRHIHAQAVQWRQQINL